MENVERFVLMPNLQLFGGIEVNDETSFDIYNDDKTVHQIFKDHKLTTIIDKTWSYGKHENVEHSELTTSMPNGTILIWDEQNGYIMPEYKMQRLSEAVESYSNIMKGVIEDDSSRIEGGNA